VARTSRYLVWSHPTNRASITMIATMSDREALAFITIVGLMAIAALDETGQLFSKPTPDRSLSGQAFVLALLPPLAEFRGSRAKPQYCETFDLHEEFFVG
jgi:hypothetical protein